MRLPPALSPRRTFFGDFAIVAFLLSQALDGVLTYLGVREFGPGIEANPLIGSVLPVLGATVTLAGAKFIAAGLGVVLHLRGVHRAVAVLTAMYIAGALVPWAAILW